MLKQRVFTTLGILLSFAIAIGGWAMVNTLMDIRSDNLMSAAGVSPILMPLQLPQTDSVYDPAHDQAYYPTIHILTEQNIVSILRNLAAPGREMPHEPTPEQIDMQEAIYIGRRWLESLNQHIEMRHDILHIYDTSAHLSQNIQRGGDGFLPPEYSFWTVTFSSRIMAVTMLINAVEGQVWRTDLTLSLHVRPTQAEFYATIIDPYDLYAAIFIPERAAVAEHWHWIYFETTTYDMINALSDFVATIGIYADESLTRFPIHGQSDAFGFRRPFAAGEGYAAVNITGPLATADAGRLFFQNFSIYLGVN